MGYLIRFVSFHWYSIHFIIAGEGAIYRYLSRQGNFRYLVFSYLRLEGISDFEGNRPVNHQIRLKSRPGDNKGIKYHQWLYLRMDIPVGRLLL